MRGAPPTGMLLVAYAYLLLESAALGIVLSGVFTLILLLLWGHPC